MDNNLQIKDLHSKIASLESKMDLLETELSYLNELLMRCGFPQGVESLKSTVEELLLNEAEHYDTQQENPWQQE